MVKHIEALRESGQPLSGGDARASYAAIGAACKRRDLMPDDMVGDMTVRRLRARFGALPTKPGLVFAAGRWLPPARVLASQLPVWQLPVAFSSLRGLLQAGEITTLGPDSFDPVVREQAFTTGAAMERQFSAAVELLRDWLTRHDNKLLPCPVQASRREDLDRTQGKEAHQRAEACTRGQ